MIERVVIVGVETQENYRYFEASMSELVLLTETAQGEVVASLIQKRPAVDRQTLVGKGKLQEIADVVDREEADLVVFNHELSPRQGSYIQEQLDVRVIDRVQLILDIFALRARSKEGQLQVELAQLNYLLPRLTGQGAAMSRLGGGIGTRGPGETKLEMDRRHIRDKITAIKRELKDVSAHRERNRQKRKNANVFQIGLIGYTNAGKSTILNGLTTADTYEKNELFATLDPLTKQWTIGEAMAVTLTDTVGFIQDLPTQLIEAFQSTLEESRNMDVLLHVVDASAEQRHLQEETVMSLLNELGMSEIPVLTVYNKMDCVDADQFMPTLFPNVQISAKSEASLEQLEEAIVTFLKELFVPYHIKLPAEKSYQAQSLKQTTLLMSEEYNEDENSYDYRGFASQTSPWIRKEASEK